MAFDEDFVNSFSMGYSAVIKSDVLYIIMLDGQYSDRMYQIILDVKINNPYFATTVKDSVPGVSLKASQMLELQQKRGSQCFADLDIEVEY